MPELPADYEEHAAAHPAHLGGRRRRHRGVPGPGHPGLRRVPDHRRPSGTSSSVSRCARTGPPTPGSCSAGGRTLGGASRCWSTTASRARSAASSATAPRRSRPCRSPRRRLRRERAAGRAARRGPGHQRRADDAREARALDYARRPSTISSAAGAWATGTTSESAAWARSRRSPPGSTTSSSPRSTRPLDAPGLRRGRGRRDARRPRPDRARGPRQRPAVR